MINRIKDQHMQMQSLECGGQSNSCAWFSFLERCYDLFDIHTRMSKFLSRQPQQLSLFRVTKLQILRPSSCPSPVVSQPQWQPFRKATLTTAPKCRVEDVPPHSIWAQLMSVHMHVHMSIHKSMAMRIHMSIHMRMDTFAHVPRTCPHTRLHTCL